MVKKYSTNIAIIFKQANQSHYSIVEQFQNHQNIFINHSSNLAFYNNIKVVWFENARYLNQEDVETIPALEAIKNNTKIDLVNDTEDIGEHFPNQNELETLNIDRDVWNNTLELANLCSASIEYHQNLLPKFDAPSGSSSKEYLWSQLQSSLKKMKLNHDERYTKRLEHEYRVITEMGFEDYFLIVSDLIHYAKTHDVMVGPGRGSSAGSLVSFLLGITTIDPIRFNLLFERF